MSLKNYKDKRKFSETDEPSGESDQADQNDFIFVAQKHDARRLHYDFRLCHNGVLKSWAVPKGFSLDPKVHHLAIMVEDHPTEYADFEGIIPTGNYGAGTVMVWDKGSYSVPQKNKNQIKEAIEKGLQKGHISFILRGNKLSGEFALVRMEGDQNQWLLFKKNDEFAVQKDLEKFDRSVKTNRTMKEIRENLSEDQRWSSERGLDGAIKAPFLKNIKPMLATLIDRPFSSENWIFEIKWDGYRAISEIKNGEVSLNSRTGKSFTQSYPEICRSLKKISHQVIFDGEIVVLDESGKPDFQKIQNFHRDKKGILKYIIFDIIYLNGYDLRNVPLIKRKATLRSLIVDNDSFLQYGDFIEKEGKAFFGAAEKLGLEGVIAKKKESIYRSGIRSRSWLKIKRHNTQTGVIAGFTEPRGGRKNLGALILGVYKQGKLTYIGHVGGGLSDTALKDVAKKLRKIEIENSPFPEKIKTNAPVHWTKPELVCEVLFSEWTKEGIMRQPIFLGLREDFDPNEVVLEIPESKDTVLLTKDDSKKLVIQNHTVKISHPTKLFWPDEGFTKLDLINYYRKVSPYIIPHLKDRPESLNRYPNGIYGDHFYHKNFEEVGIPDWIETVKVKGESGEICYILCQNEETLIYMANLGSIEINPWLSRIKKLDNPDYVVIDLDPVNIDFSYVVETALAVKKILDKAGAPSYCKTSGATGLHIYVPLGAKYSYEQAREFSQVVAYLAHDLVSDFTSLERLTSKRDKKVYIDFLQNHKGQTLAAPYSVRPVRGALVSTPLKWSEVNKSLTPDLFNMKNILERLDKIGDLWRPLLEEQIDLKECLDKLSK